MGKHMKIHVTKVIYIKFTLTLKQLRKIKDSKDHRDTSKALVKAGIADSLNVPSALIYA